MEKFWALIRGDKPVFVVFYADWCPHCRRMLPIIRKLEERADIVLRTYDIDEPKNNRLVNYYQIQAIPLMMIYKAGEQSWRMNGEIGGSELEQVVDRLVHK